MAIATLLCFIVIFTSIVGFFSQEFLRFFNRVFSIFWIKLGMPLLFASWIVELYALWGWKALYSLREMLQLVEHTLASMLPFQMGSILVTRILLLVLIAFLPIAITTWMARKKPGSQAQFWGYRLSLILWTIAVILLITLES